MKRPMVVVASPEKDRIADGESRRNRILKWLFLPLRWAFKLWFVLVFFVTLLILYVPFRILLKDPAGFRKAYLLKRKWAQVLQYLAFLPVRVDRRAGLPPPPYIICSNHSSYLDIVHMYNVIPEFFIFMGKQELQRWPMIGMFFKEMNIAVNRGNNMEAVRSLRRAALALDQGTSVAIFPEGTIPPFIPRMKAFKDGAFKLAVEKQVPIVPVTFLDHWRLFGEPTDPFSRARPGISRVIVHEAISTAGLTEADLVTLRQRVFKVIEEPLLHV